MTELRFGYFLNAEYPAGTDVRSAVRQAEDIVRHCAEVGLDSVFVGEHFSHGPSLWLPPIPLLSRLAALDADLDLGTAVVVAPLHNPMVLAEEAALIDQMCGGRFTLGLSAGWNKAEFAALGVEVAGRGSRLTETASILRLLWGTAGKASFHGKHYTFDDIELTLRPVQAGGPPIWIGASGPQGIRRAAEFADTWVISSHAQAEAVLEQTRRHDSALAELGKPRPGRRAALRNLYVAPTHDQAVREAAPYLTASYQMFSSWGLFRDVLAEQPDVDYELAARRAIIGDPDEVAQQVVDFVTEAGVSELLIRMQWMGMPDSHVRACLELFAAQVLPKVRSALPG